ncbi:hypothetical protein VOLCADRAFT_101380 [Volvox carteri f. nagariensis]|uniref:Uncharacterized protein n=1 Tax=Volvox carteri f. nagariensis TaxID=3068 RepID=D8UMH6_VOLCA|nr:uncharacterized protein VOLCADRAFT_101380 [Volvox carteri f. nagariensis]EFJ39073.1 hypothetical protein VOLCADRAFT_101380 [Volvox carteri f. nagariensis]|eukprot:XP_002959862.1 hypothetical protein VOLCADRAFT_101380 [Volvox carteri f. nagariensis]
MGPNPASTSVSFQLTFTAGPAQVGTDRLWSGMQCNTATIVGGPVTNGIVLLQIDSTVLASIQTNKYYGVVVDVTHVQSAILPASVVNCLGGGLVNTFKTTARSEVKSTQARRVWSILTARLRLPALNPYVKPPLVSDAGSMSIPLYLFSAKQHAQQSAGSETSNMLLAWEQREWPGSITTLPQDGTHARASLSPNPSVSSIVNDRKVLPLVLTVNQRQYPVCSDSPEVLRQLPGFDAFFADLPYDDVEIRAAFCASRPFSIVGTATTTTIGRTTFVTAFQQ